MNLFNKAFFELQLDFAREIAKHFNTSLEEALFKYTSIYTRLIGFSDFDPPRQDHPRWQQVIAELPTDQSEQLDYIFQQYLDFEEHKPPTDNGQKNLVVSRTRTWTKTTNLRCTSTTLIRKEIWVEIELTCVWMS